jgi:hypothetical protein
MIALLVPGSRVESGVERESRPQPPHGSKDRQFQGDTQATQNISATLNIVSLVQGAQMCNPIALSPSSPLQLQCQLHLFEAVRLQLYFR